MAEKVLSARDKILAANDRKEELVNVPSWDTEVLVRELSAFGRMEIVGRSLLSDGATQEEALIDTKKFAKNKIIACLYDPKTRKQIFTWDDESVVCELGSDGVEAVMPVINRLNGMGSKALADAEKN